MSMMPKKRRELLVQKVFLIPVDLLGKLREESQKTGESESQIIRNALRDALGHDKTR